MNEYILCISMTELLNTLIYDYTYLHYTEGNVWFCCEAKSGLACNGRIAMSKYVDHYSKAFLIMGYFQNFNKPKVNNDKVLCMFRLHR